MATVNFTFSHRWMGIRLDLRPGFCGLTCERERFMLIRCMSGYLGSREGQVAISLTAGRPRDDRGQCSRT